MALLTGILSLSTLVAQPTLAVIRPHPLPSPQEIANLESHVLEMPEDMAARVELLQLYLEIVPPPGFDSARRSVRLQYILYMVEHNPEAPASASRAAYIYRDSGPYANAADHEAVLERWLQAVQDHPKSNAVIFNAVRFLKREDPDVAEQVLRRALDADPDNRELAANLGFLYALEIMRPNLAAHATAELEQSSNAIVIAAAGTALPNLAVKTSGAPVADPKLFDLAHELSERARRLAPGDSDIQGPMPLIKYFAAGQQGR
jgi:tetratricopeptide (TPR) repeat protein